MPSYPAIHRDPRLTGATVGVIAVFLTFLARPVGVIAQLGGFLKIDRD